VDNGEKRTSQRTSRDFVSEWTDEDEREANVMKEAERERREEEEALTHALHAEGFSDTANIIIDRDGDPRVVFRGDDAYLLLEKLQIKRRERENGQ
jgi:hypothetical protein